MVVLVASSDQFEASPSGFFSFILNQNLFAGSEAVPQAQNLTFADSLETNFSELAHSGLDLKPPFYR